MAVIFLARDKAIEAADKIRNKVAEISAKIQEVEDRVVGPYRKELDEALAK